MIPREVRYMIYELLSEDDRGALTITRKEASSKMLNNKNFGPHTKSVYSGEVIARDAVENHYWTRKLIIQDVDDVQDALTLDIFGLGMLPINYVRMIEVDIRTHHYTTKACNISTGAQPDYNNMFLSVQINMEKFLELKHLSVSCLHIRIRSEGLTWSDSAHIVKTLNLLRSVVLDMKKVGSRVTVELLPVYGSPSWKRKDVTDNFDLELPTWNLLQQQRLKDPPSKFFCFCYSSIP